MEIMLDAMQDGRRIGLFTDIDQPLYAQDICAVTGNHVLQGYDKRHHRQRFVEDHAKCVN